MQNTNLNEIGFRFQITQSEKYFFVNIHAAFSRVVITQYIMQSLTPFLATWWNEFNIQCTWWRHQMETFSALLAIWAGNSPVPGEFPAQRPVTRSFDVFFDLRLNKRLSKQSWGWWFETPLHSLWRHCNVAINSEWWEGWWWWWDGMIHDDVIKWKHFPRYWPFVRGIHRSPVNSPCEGQWRGALMFPMICVWINCWVNNREAGD